MRSNYQPKHGEPGHFCHDTCSHSDDSIHSGEQLNKYIKEMNELNLKNLNPAISRRNFVKTMAMFGGALAFGGSLLSSIGCTGKQNTQTGSFASDTVDKNLEKPDLTIGFIPITCATPIIMADPMGFYKKHGLHVVVKKYGGWADIRDAFIAGEIDAAHLLSPMPIALSLGIGSAKVPTRLPAIENINGQAITLALKHQGVKEPQDFKGMTLGVPFEFSMHNLLIRHYLSKGGVDPDKDVSIRVIRPPDMVANLASGNIDGYLAPDPFNQRAVHEKVGFIFKLSKEIWNNHPCCAFAVKQEFIDRNPLTYQALLSAIADATNYSSDPSHREEIAKAISERQYLNQPEEVVKAVLTGKFDNGLGSKIDDPKRIDFDAYPWQSYGAWITTQLIRWGYIPEDKASGLDVKKVAEEVFLTEDCRKVHATLGYSTPSERYKIEMILGDTFDVNAPEKWTQRFITY